MDEIPSKKYADCQFKKKIVVSSEKTIEQMLNKSDTSTMVCKQNLQLLKY